MLALIGEAPVNTLEEPDGVTAKAIRILDDEVIMMQGKNYWFNQYPALLPLDTNNEIMLPSNVSRVDANNTSIIQRGLKLYNKYNNTFVFATPIRVSLTVTLSFEELPLTARLLVKATAEWFYEMQEQGDNSISNALRYTMDRCNTMFQDENLQQQNNNVFNNPEVAERANRQVLGGGSLAHDVRGY